MGVWSAVDGQLCYGWAGIRTVGWAEFGLLPPMAAAAATILAKKVSWAVGRMLLAAASCFDGAQAQPINRKALKLSASVRLRPCMTLPPWAASGSYQLVALRPNF